jgi:hypothetical protein
MNWQLAITNTFDGIEQQGRVDVKFGCCSGKTKNFAVRPVQVNAWACARLFGARRFPAHYNYTGSRERIQM